MFRSGRSYTYGRAILAVCLILLVSGFRPASEIYQALDSEHSNFFIQRGTPVAIPNFIDLAAGCNWSGIGGQVFDQTGSPVIGLKVKLSGTYDGHPVSESITTGSSTRFGSGGFDVKLGNRPIASQTISLQLLDAAGVALSPPFVLGTYGTCQQNLLVVNLTPITMDNVFYLPMVRRP
jgi:hypothetical protein